MWVTTAAPRLSCLSLSGMQPSNHAVACDVSFRRHYREPGRSPYTWALRASSELSGCSHGGIFRTCRADSHPPCGSQRLNARYLARKPIIVSILVHLFLEVTSLGTTQTLEPKCPQMSTSRACRTLKLGFSRNFTTGVHPSSYPL